MENNAGKKYEIPIWHKANLTVDEAAYYTGIGRDKLRSISNRAEETTLILHISLSLHNKLLFNNVEFLL